MVEDASTLIVSMGLAAAKGVDEGLFCELTLDEAVAFAVAREALLRETLDRTIDQLITIAKDKRKVEDLLAQLRATLQ